MAITQEEFAILSSWKQWTDASNMLYHSITAQAFGLLRERTAKVSTLVTEGQWLKRQQEVRQILMELVGPFPERTPLNPEIVGTINKKGYRMEKVIYESRPEFYVTVCLFIPDGLTGRAPVILNPIGHSDDAFREPLYQTVILNLVKKGFIVLTYDPIGQGERLQYFNHEEGRSNIGWSTCEHSYIGSQCFVCGSSFARYRIWDGIRGIDYLLTRDEVDSERIGANGISGGGTLTSYISAFDERVYAAAPECYIAGFRRLLESIGPQDAEQNLYHGISSGIDHADLLEVRAPKPVLIMSTTRDFFSIQGARETYDEVKKAYKTFGKEDNLSMTEDDAPHDSTRRNREAMYAFFQKHLNLPGNPIDEEVEFLTEEELKITETGQVSTSLGGKTVFDINKAEAQTLIQNLENSRKDLSRHLQLVRHSAKHLSGYIHPDRTPGSIFVGRYQHEGFSVERYVLNGEGECVIPLILTIPDKCEKHPVIIYIHSHGKEAKKEDIEWLTRKGFAVLAPDLIGTGETGGAYTAESPYNPWYNTWFGSILIGRSVLGIQAGDIVRIIRYLESRDDIDCNNIAAIAWGKMCPALIHAATFDSAICRIALMEPLISYGSIVMNRYYNPSLVSSIVAGALTSYDLPDITACIAPRKLLMINIADQSNNAASSELIEKEMKIARSAYAIADSEENLAVKSQVTGEGIKTILSAWLE
jgi:cephalosporin-C deacetylase-like acetyl esterase